MFHMGAASGKDVVDRCDFIDCSLLGNPVLSYWEREFCSVSFWPGKTVGLIKVIQFRWDEAHFGKFASHYLRGTFYFDVHPPLGKMLVALGGKLAGYDGTFDFSSGGDYTTKVNYVPMRMFVASFGAMIVPLAYMTCIQLRFRQSTSILVALMMLFGKPARRRHFSSHFNLFLGN